MPIIDYSLCDVSDVVAQTRKKDPEASKYLPIALTVVDYWNNDQIAFVKMTKEAALELIGEVQNALVDHMVEAGEIGEDEADEFRATMYTGGK